MILCPQGSSSDDFGDVKIVQMELIIILLVQQIIKCLSGAEPNLSLTGCNLCIPGTFSYACPVDQFSSNSGLKYCEFFPEGKQINNLNTGCELCPACNFSTGNGSSCISYPSNTYSIGEFSNYGSKCVCFLSSWWTFWICQFGFYSDPINCLPFPTDTFSNTRTNQTYSPGFVASSIASCVVNFVLLVLVLIQLCKPGQYSSPWLDCPVGKFSSFGG